MYNALEFRRDFIAITSFDSENKYIIIKGITFKIRHISFILVKEWLHNSCVTFIEPCWNFTFVFYEIRLPELPNHMAAVII